MDSQKWQFNLEMQESTNAYKLIQVLILNVREDFLFKHKIKSKKGCLVDALAIRGDEGRERLR